MSKSRAVYSFTIPTALGEFVAGYSASGLARLEFPSESKPLGPDRTMAVDPPAAVLRWHSLTVAALRCALEGRCAGALPPFDFSSGTAFQQQVWRALCRIGVGETLSYGELARAAGRPKATRAVAGACGANPVPVLVPCHRVLAAGQRLGGFSGGLHWKRELLGREGVRFIE